MTAAQRGESCAKELIHLLQAHRNLSPSSQVIVLKNTRRAGGTNRSGPVVHSGILKFNMPAVFRLVLNVLNEPFQIKIQEYLEVAVQKGNGEMRGLSPCDGDVLCFYSYVYKKKNPHVETWTEDECDRNDRVCLLTKEMQAASSRILTSRSSNCSIISSQMLLPRGHKQVILINRPHATKCCLRVYLLQRSTDERQTFCKLFCFRDIS